MDTCNLVRLIRRARREAGLPSTATLEMIGPTGRRFVFNAGPKRIAEIEAEPGVTYALHTINRKARRLVRTDLTPVVAP